MKKKTLLFIGLAVIILVGLGLFNTLLSSPMANQGISHLKNWLFILAPLGATFALVFAFAFYLSMKKAPEGEPDMIKIAKLVKNGALAYLKRQYSVVALFFLFTFLVFIILAFVLKVQSKWVPFAFLTGGFFSGLAGYLGMITATDASSRTAFGAKKSLNTALKIAFRSGAVMGLVVVGLGLIDITMWFTVLHYIAKIDLHATTTIMLNFEMGASLQALFARVGGGIFTKAADVGADLVGKVEANIPEDDPRNPAAIADNVGDNVGDVAGMGADLYESYCGAILATAALGASAFIGSTGSVGIQFYSVILPMLIASGGIISSIIGIFIVRSNEKAEMSQLLAALNRGIYASAILIVILSFIFVKLLLPQNFGVFWSIIIGLGAGIIIGKSTEYYTSHSHKPTVEVAKQSETGAATVIISGLAVGMESTAIPVITVGLAILLSYGFAGGFNDMVRGLYGVGIAAVGMLSTLGITLATDAYGPIADNAGGNAEMTHQPDSVREKTDALDALGNTTAATGKGFAIGSAALTAMALIAAYLEEIKVGLGRLAQHSPGLKTVVGYSQQMLDKAAILHLSLPQIIKYFEIQLMNPRVLVGIFLGSMAAFLFCALTMSAVGRAAGKIVIEARRQFKEIVGLLQGKAEPDSAAAVKIVTASAQKEMVLPALLAIILPLFTGLILGVEGVVGLLVGALSTGFVLAIMMANAGGSWDNAKKYIETSGYGGGKGSAAHKASIVGDTVGDPFKDTAGPALNILIKLMSMVSIVFAGLIVKYSPYFGHWLGMIR